MILELLAYAPMLGSHWSVGVQVDFDGFLPILGGREAKVSVEMDVDLVFDLKNPLVAVSEILKLKALLNDKPLPLDAKSAKAFFPKTTVKFNRAGEILESDAPDTKLPVNLPGLDAKRFPDVSYLPIQFSKSEVTIGKSYEFDKVFSGSKVHYRVTPESITNESVLMKVELTQDLTSYEDDRANPVDEADAKVFVRTKLTGNGSGVFSRKTGLFEKFSVVAISTGEVKDKKGAELKARHLKTSLKLVTKPKG